MSSLHYLSLIYYVSWQTQVFCYKTHMSSIKTLLFQTIFTQVRWFEQVCYVLFHFSNCIKMLSPTYSMIISYILTFLFLCWVINHSVVTFYVYNHKWIRLFKEVPLCALIVILSNSFCLKKNDLTLRPEVYFWLWSVHIQVSHLLYL